MALAATPANGAEDDPYLVPNGTPAELARFIEGILNGPAPAAADRQRAIEALQQAADKLLAGKPTDDQALVAVGVKVMAGSAPLLEELAAKLAKANLPKAARRARAGALELGLRSVATVTALEGAIAAVNVFLTEGPVEAADMQLALSAAAMAERADKAELAAGVLTTFSKQAAASPDRQVAALARNVEPDLRRVSLVGNPMKIEGVDLAGERFDWSEYRGKVVLVDFWATWCGPCVAEIPNMKRAYEEHHDNGFEIIGISVDRDRGKLESFVQDRSIPWKILFDQGSRSPVASYYGISGIPAMFLIGRDGNVATLNARGSRLDQLLKKLLEAPGPAVASVGGSESDPDPASGPATEPAPPSEPIVILFTPEGASSVDGEPLSGKSLAAAMTSKVALNARAGVLVRIEAAVGVEAKKVIRAIESLKSLGYTKFKYVPAKKD